MEHEGKTIALSDMDDSLHDETDFRLEESESVNSTDWVMFGNHFPRSEVRFFAQVVILYVVIITCLANLSVGNTNHESLWISLLCSCIGYLLPSPHISSKSKGQDGTMNQSS